MFFFRKLILIERASVAVNDAFLKISKFTKQKIHIEVCANKGNIRSFDRYMIIIVC